MPAKKKTTKKKTAKKKTAKKKTAKKKTAKKKTAKKKTAKKKASPRFVLSDEDFGGCKYRNWDDADATIIASTPRFLAKLWTLFGEPDEICYEGFQYFLHDQETGLHFRVYCGGSGPAFGGEDRNTRRLEKMLCDFEDLLDETPLKKNCSVQFDCDFGLMTCGTKNGKLFEDLDEDAFDDEEDDDINEDW